MLPERLIVAFAALQSEDQALTTPNALETFELSVANECEVI